MVGLAGPGGAGKSTVASLLISREEVREHFHEGVLWLQVGKGANDRLPELMLDLASMVWETVLLKRGTSVPPRKASMTDEPEDGAAYIREMAVDKGIRNFLVVADDVWEEEVLAELRKAGACVLYTSRRYDLLPETPVRLDKILEAEAEAVLRLAAELGESERLPDAAYDLIHRSNYIVMDLAFVASWVRRRTDERAWRRAVDRIAAYQEGGVGGRVVSWRTAVLHAGLEELDNEQKDLYLSLAVLPKGLAFEDEVAAVLLYGQDRSTEDLSAARNVSAELERFSILTLEDGGTYRVHDSHADFIREEIEMYPKTRERALREWRKYASSIQALVAWPGEQLVEIWRHMAVLEHVAFIHRPFFMVSDAMRSSDPLYVDVLDALQNFYHLRTAPARAYENAVDILVEEESVLGSDHAGLYPSLKCAEICARRAGLANKAEYFSLRARPFEEDTSGGMDHLAVSDTLQAFGVDTPVARTIEDHGTFLRYALRSRIHNLGPNHPHVAFTLCELGVGALRAARMEEAEKLLLQALDSADTRGESRPLHWLGVWHFELGRVKEAEGYLQRSLMLRENQLGPDHHEVAVTLRMLGKCALSAGRREEAISFFTRSLTILENNDADGVCRTS